MIEFIKLIHINLPLNTPYNLSYNKINCFDVYYCAVFDGKNFGIGEITPLEGYFNSKIKDIWERNISAVTSVSGTEPEEAVSIVQDLLSEDKFIYSAIITALENIAYKIENQNKKLPVFKLKLIGTLMGENINETADEIKRLAKEEYSVIKVKVGKNVEKDIIKIKNILDILPDGEVIRIDANQGYSFSDAEKFITSIPSGKVKKIELFEQPLKTGEWLNMSRLHELSELPLMLDESICNEEDISRAISLKCCSFIKLKLMKQGSFMEMKKMFNLADSNGLNVIIGNGVQSEIGCINEAYIIDRLKANSFASENNGFLKQSKRFLKNNIIKKDGGFSFDFDFDFDKFYNNIKPFIVKEFDF